MGPSAPAIKNPSGTFLPAPGAGDGDTLWSDQYRAIPELSRHQGWAIFPHPLCKTESVVSEFAEGRLVQQKLFCHQLTARQYQRRQANGIRFLADPAPMVRGRPKTAPAFDVELNHLRFSQRKPRPTPIPASWI